VALIGLTIGKSACQKGLVLLSQVRMIKYI
jgi:hypothetical protein